MTTALLVLAALLVFDVLFVAVLWTLGTLRRRHLRRHPPRPLLDFSDATFDWWHEDWPSREPAQGHGFSRTGTTMTCHSVGTDGFPREPYDWERAA